MSAWLDTPGRHRHRAQRGTSFIADSNNNVIVRADSGPSETRPFLPVRGRQSRAGPGFSGDNGPALKAQLDTPDGVCIAPRRRFLVVAELPQRIASGASTGRRASSRRWAGSGRETAFDGGRSACRGCGAQHPEPPWRAPPTGDLYIADTLNYRVRMIEGGKTRA